MSIKHFGTYLAPTKDLRLANGVNLEYRQDILFEHFNAGAVAINSWAPQTLVTTETGAATPFAINATAGSNAVCVTGATTNNAQELAGKKVGWNPSTRGGLVLECRLKVVAATTATDGDFYIGFADAVTYTNSLPYVVSAASALTTNVPSNFAGFAYSSIATSGALFLTGGNHIGMVTTKADVDTVTAPSVSVVKDSSFHVYRLEIDSTGAATFFIDDVHVGTVAGAVTANVEYTPYINIVAKNSHAVTATLDYLRVSAPYV